MRGTEPKGGIFPPWGVLALVGWLLAGPRIELLSVAGSSLRLEDFLFIALALHVAIEWRTIRDSKLIRSRISVVLLTSLIAVAAGTSTGRVDGLLALLFALRPLEYWFVYPALALALHQSARARTQTIETLLVAVTCLQALVAALQYVGGLNIGFSSFSNTRGAGLSAGPYELGAMGAMLACYWFGRRRPALGCVATIATLMSQSRTSLIGLTVALVFMTLTALRRGRSTRSPHLRRPPRPLTVVGITAAVVVTIMVSPVIMERIVAPAFTRVQSTSILDAWNEARTIADRTPWFTTSDDYGRVAYTSIVHNVLQDTTSSDASNVVRFYRWQLLLRESGHSADTLLFGLGPSYAGPSVDGNYLRIYVESGLLGLAAWLVLFSTWLRRTERWFVAAVISLLIGATFIDLFAAMRPMALLWTLCATSWATENNDVSGVEALHDFKRTKEPLYR